MDYAGLFVIWGFVSPYLSGLEKGVVILQFFFVILKKLLKNLEN